MLTEPQYITFDELLDSVKIDFKTYDLEGAFDAQQLIKPVIKVNYLLGLKVNPARSKMLEVHNYKAKLPADMHVLNFALVCEDRKIMETSPVEFIKKDAKLSAQVVQHTFSATIKPGSNSFLHPLNSTQLMIQVLDMEGSLVAATVDFPKPNEVVIYSESEKEIINAQITLVGARNGGKICLPTWEETEIVEYQSKPRVIWRTATRREDYSTLVPLKLQKNKGIAPECMNLYSRAQYAGHIENGFLVSNISSGKIFVNYQSVMEDDAGNLLVLDHPKVNEFYEYTIKERVLENLLMNGEDVAQKLGLMQQKLRTARTEAISFMNTPDFATLKSTWELNRKAMYSKYYSMFYS